MSEESNRHPDLFTEDEALRYLHLNGEDVRILKTLRDSHDLPCYPFGRTTLYHRTDLDALVVRMCGKEHREAQQPERGPRLKIGGK